MGGRDFSLKFIGDIAVVRIAENSVMQEDTVGQLILSKYPHIRSVVRVYGVTGPMRTPNARVLAGSNETETLHVEYGCCYLLDVLKLMFSLGNSHERMRLASQVRPGEVVVDMFAGVGQFTVPIAVKASPKHVYAFEINPTAYEYLVRNIHLNKLEGRVTPILDDARNSPSYGLVGGADRVVMGYLKGTIEFIPTALRLCKPSGSVIHFHELAGRNAGWQQLFQECTSIAAQQGLSLRLINYRMVKSYSARMAH
ncbi:MAG: class I SAM-dependent methyltransferase family protein, partial [Nitrososphaerota archaeon]